MASPSVSETAALASLADGVSALQGGRIEAAADHFIEAASLAAPRSVTQARAIANLANIRAKQKQYDESLILNTKALSIFRECGEIERCCVVLYNSALLNDSNCDLPQAINALAEIFKLQKQCGGDASTRKAIDARANEAAKWLSSGSRRKAASALGITIEGKTVDAFLASLGSDVFMPAASRRDGLPSDKDFRAPSTGGETCPFTSHDEIMLQSGLAEKAAVAIGTDNGCPPVEQLQSGEFVSEFGFEHLRFSDTFARAERGLALLDGVEQMLKARAAASDSYARALAESADAVSSVLSTTGAGTQALPHGWRREGSYYDKIPGAVSASNSGAAGAALALMKSAFGGFLSSSTGSTNSGSVSSDDTPVSPKSVPFLDVCRGATCIADLEGTADDESSSASVERGGYDSVSTFLLSVRKQTREEASRHQQAASSLRETSSKLKAYSLTYNVKISKALNVALDMIRMSKEAAANLQRANAQCERARKEAEECRNRYQAAKDSAGAVTEAELSKRGKRSVDAQNAANAAEEGVRSAADALVVSRRRRDELLAEVSREIQRLDLDMRSEALGKLLAEAFTSPALLSAAETSASVIRAISQAVSTEVINAKEDERVYIHQRKTAMMIHGELGRRLPPLRSGVEEEDEGDLSHLIPNPLPPSSSLKHQRRYIKSEVENAAICYSWVSSIVAKDEADGLSRQGELSGPHEKETGQGGVVAPGETAGDEKEVTSVAAVDGPAEATVDIEALGGEPLPMAVPPVLLELSASTSRLAAEARDHEECKEKTSTVAGKRRFNVELLDDPAARNAFLRALASKRGGADQRLSPKSFFRLLRLFWWILDASTFQQDVRSAGAVMILSETFCLERKLSLSQASSSSSSSSKTVYLQQFVKHHPIWKSNSFWRELTLVSVRDEVAKLVDPQSVASNTSRLSLIFSEAEKREKATRASAGRQSSPTAETPGTATSFSRAAQPSSAGSEEGAYFALAQLLWGQILATRLSYRSFATDQDDPMDKSSSLVVSLSLETGLPKELLRLLVGS
jgi:tetratricopeptide (TPR) repeat protein